MSIGKRELKILFVLLGILLTYILLDRYYRLRDSYYRDYLKHKEIMFLLANYKDRKKEEPREELIRELFSVYGVEFKSFRQVETGYEVKGSNLRGENLPALVYSLEDKGIKILKLKATDNTGQGIFELEMLIR